MLRSLGQFLWDAKWIIAFALVLFGANLDTLNMRGDSMIYAAVSKNVLTGTNPLLMELNGEPYLNKPPLYFWWSGLFMSLLGTGAVGTKLGALIASTGLCVVLYRFTRHLTGLRQVGLLAVLIFGITRVVYMNTYAARMESLLTLFVVASVWAAWRYANTRALRWALLGGLFAGLGFLTKGPIAVVPLAGFGLYALLMDRSLLWGRSLLQLCLGLVVFVVSFGWWYLYAGTQSEFGSVFFGEQIGNRMVFDHVGSSYRRPWHVYFFTLFKYDVQWMLLGGLGLWKAWRVDELRKPVVLLLSVSLVHLVIIHFIEAKSSRYLYQFYPFWSVLAAYGVWSLRKLPMERILAFGVIGYAIVLQFVPSSSSWNVYGPLKQISDFASDSNLVVVADPNEFRHLSDKAALDFYFDEAITQAPTSGPYLIVLPVSNPIEGAVEMLRTRNIWVGRVDSRPNESLNEVL